MGLLRKLAELVVEFPEEERAQEQNRPQGDDVVAAIEQIRMDLEQSTQTEFTRETAAEPPAKPGGAQQPAVKPPTARSGLIPEATEQVELPRVLSIQEIFEKARIPAGVGFDIYRVEAMLEDQEIVDLDLDMRARMVKMTIKNMGHEVTDMLADAARRDQALEEYRRFLTGHAATIREKVESINAGIQSKIDDFIARHQAVIEDNNRKLKQLQSDLAEFERSKSAEEQRLFNIAAPFVGQDPNPVDIGSE